MRPDRSGSGARTASAALLAATMLARPGLAQEPGPVVVSPRPELKWLHFHELDVALELEWRRDVDEVDRAVGGEVRDVQDRFRPPLIRARGSRIREFHGCALDSRRLVMVGLWCRPTRVDLSHVVVEREAIRHAHVVRQLSVQRVVAVAGIIDVLAHAVHAVPIGQTSKPNVDSRKGSAVAVIVERG